MTLRARPPRVALAVVAALSAAGASLLVAGPAGAALPGRVSFPAAAPPLPSGAVVSGALPANRVMTVDVVLAPADPEALSAFVHAVSTPGSPDYRHYLGPGQFAGRFGPTPATIAGIRSWLASAGLSVGVTSRDGLIVPAQGTVAALDAAFSTSLSSVALPAGQRAYTSTEAPSLPATVAPGVASIIGLNDLGHWHSDLRHDQVDAPGTTAAPASPSASVRPSSSGPQPCASVVQRTSPGGPVSMTQLADAYSFSPLYAQGREGGGVTIGLYELEPYEPSDIATFFNCYGIAPSVSNVNVDGGAGTGPGSGEATLDIEDAAALAPQATFVVYSGPNNNFNGPGAGPFDTLDQMATDDRAQVLSTSWGVCEAGNIPPGNSTGSAAAAEAEVFSEMAAQGQTMVAASGDSGSSACWDPEMQPAPPITPSELEVDDPASQVDVLGVGGTELPSGTPAGERVWNDCAGRVGDACALNDDAGASGGGISDNWDMPSWQVPVAGSLSSGSPCNNSAGDCREVPDVSADAAPSTGFVTYNSGYAQQGWAVVGGTSGSAPLWAAALALADEGCAAPVGLAAPALYALGTSKAAVFNDVSILGNNDLTNENNGLYPTAVGYDMATGWGSPDVAALLSALQPAGGCPVVSALSAGHGPVTGGGTLTIFGSSLAPASAVHFGPTLTASILSDSAGAVTVSIPPAPGPEAVNVTVTTPAGTSGVVAAARYVYGTPRNGLGYWLGASDGGVFSFGDAQFYGSMGGRPLNAPVVGLAATPDDGGYWEVAADGGLFSFGDAQFYGSMGGQPLNAPIVGITATADGGGYWEVAADGGVFSFGDAQFYGSMGGRPLNAPIVAVASTPDGRGYWEVAADGGLFSFGDAQFYGSMGGRPLNAPIVSMAPTLDGGGYWEVAADGGIFSFGDAQFYGSTGAVRLHKPVVAMSGTPDAGGYWEVAADGGLFSFGDANFFGSTGGLNLVAPIVGMAAT